jgi:hypothetical protein
LISLRIATCFSHWPMPGCTTEDGDSKIERHTIKVREEEEDTCLSYDATETARERGTIVSDREREIRRHLRRHSETHTDTDRHRQTATYTHKDRGTIKQEKVRQKQGDTDAHTKSGTHLADQHVRLIVGSHIAVDPRYTF